MNDNGQTLVLDLLKRIDEKLDKVVGEHSATVARVAALEAKLGVYMAIAGFGGATLVGVALRLLKLG